MPYLDDVNDFLKSGGVASAKFDQVGAAVSGVLTHVEKQQQRDMDTGKPKFWDDGKPREQIVAHVQTTLRDPAVDNDDGVRALYIRGNMLKAVREALRTAGAGLQIGGELLVAYTGDGERPRPGFNPPKLYAARYTPPAVTIDPFDPPAATNGTQTAPAAPQPPAPGLPAGMTQAAFAALPAEVQELLRQQAGDTPPF
jgi:hypothetical protein